MCVIKERIKTPDVGKNVSFEHIRKYVFLFVNKRLAFQPILKFSGAT